jgi:hypothetical protein
MKMLGESARPLRHGTSTREHVTRVFEQRLIPVTRKPRPEPITGPSSLPFEEMR